MSFPSRDPMIQSGMIFTEDERQELRLEAKGKKVADLPWPKYGVAPKLRVGHLGLVTRSQAEDHERHGGSMKHDWTFYREYGSSRRGRDVDVEQQCTICGKTRIVDERGRPIRR